MRHAHWKYTLVGMLIVAGAFYFSFKDTVFRWYQATGHDVVQDLKTLDGIFKKIHSTCVILNVDGQKNSINFLNVEKFTGSEVGPLNLAYPQKWQGPYLQDNLTMQGKEYQIVRDSTQALYIVPGDGVKLASGKTIGKELVLDATVDIGALITSDLQFNGSPLAIPLKAGKYQSSYTSADAQDLEA